MANDTTLTPPPPLVAAPPRPIAHWTHTLALVAVLLMTTIYGHSRSASSAASASAAAAPRIASYLTTATVEWLLLGSVIAGIYRRREFFFCALQSHVITVADSLGFGAVTYVVGLFTIAAVSGALYATPLFHQRNEAYVLALMPHRPLEFALWLVVSLTAGICEELIFRGYLMQQLTAWTRMPIASIFLAALLFGSVHLYEGLGAILPLAALAVLYGFVVRHFKGDLRVVIVAHSLQDFFVAFLALAKPWAERHAIKP